MIPWENLYLCLVLSFYGAIKNYFFPVNFEYILNLKLPNLNYIAWLNFFYFLNRYKKAVTLNLWKNLYLLLGFLSFLGAIKVN